MWDILRKKDFSLYAAYDGGVAYAYDGAACAMCERARCAGRCAESRRCAAGCGTDGGERRVGGLEMGG